MSVEIYHNPRCSKSRATLALLQQKGIEPEVRLYLEKPPGEKELRSILERLGIDALNLIRKGEAIYEDLVSRAGPPSSEEAIEWMVRHPILIERPIVVNGEHARIGRPPERVLEILDAL